MVHSVDIALPAGSVRGLRVGAGASFRAVPYAAPPTGARRFSAPEPVEPWEDVRDATMPGPTSPQRETSPALGHLLPNTVIPGDDYLHLDVRSPALAGSAPVMVFIHGGSFTSGSTAVEAYDGSTFARDGIVYVGINYRLGVEGFLWLDDGPPNLGLLDQVAALRWVQDHIASFGGDPGRVTLVGESAGAMSIGALLAMPAARGLFHRAVLQSGAGHHAISPAAARAVAHRVGEILGVPPTIDGFRGVDQERVVAAQEQIWAEVARRPTRRRWREITTNSMPFEPVVDGTVLPSRPIDALTSAPPDDVDVVVGYNTEEARLFLLDVAEEGLGTRIATRVLARRHGLRGRDVRDYRREHADGSDLDVLTALLTDAVFRLPAIRLAEALDSAYVYCFDWRSPAEDSRLGAGHAVELPFVFDALDHPDWAGIVQRERPQALADRMHAAWVAFARTGDPGWPRYGDGRLEHVFAEADELLADPRRAARVRWTGRR